MNYENKQKLETISNESTKEKTVNDEDDQKDLNNTFLEQYDAIPSNLFSPDTAEIDHQNIKSRTIDGQNDVPSTSLNKSAEFSNNSMNLISPSIPKQLNLSSLRKDDTERKFRALSILSYFIVLFLLGLPIWWYTTRVYRANLPLDEIHQFKIKDTVSSEFGMPLSLDYDILISFVHPDPEKLDIKVNPLEIEEYLQDFLKEKIPVADFIVKSQWLYLTELGVNPRKAMNHYALSEDDLPHVITPLETKLWSNISPRPSVNLVIYFPHCGSPLYIYNSKNIMLSTNSFVSPRWGGIYIMNVDQNSCELGQFNPKLRSIALTFKEMLLKLFKIDSNATENAVENFKMEKIEEMLESSKKTLKSLAQLLSEINSIVISDEVADKINVAVQSVEEAEVFLEGGNQEEALLKAKQAFKNSEEAFGHPSLLALLYFPDDQKYAIYIPLFLPVMIPVIMSLTQIRNKNKLL